MSNWFAAHLILYLKLKEVEQKTYPVWENIVLIRANSPDEAFEKANRRGMADQGDDDGTLRWNGKPAAWIFAGVRKLTLCQDSEERPDDGTEISYTEFRVSSEKAIQKLLKGQSVGIRYQEQFSD